MPSRLPASAAPVLAEVASIDADTINVTPFVADHRIELGARVTAMSGQLTLSPHESWLGRTLNALGQPIDDGGPLLSGDRDLASRAAHPLRCAATGSASR